MRNITRREFVAGAGAAAMLGGLPRHAMKLTGSSFHGSRAGDARLVEDIEMRWCPDGYFRMGSPPTEPDRRPDETQVDVKINHGFWIAKYEVTQGLWKRVMKKLPGELSAGAGDDLPVYNVNYAEAEAFCKVLTRQWQSSGDIPATWEFRLPSEAQWEYACRAGKKTATSFGDQLSSLQANFKGDFPYNGAPKGPTLGHTQKVGSYPANAWGIHDMHGNVFEWCRDWYHATLPGGSDPDLSSAKATADRNSDGTVSRVRRGGCWNDEGWACRSAFRLKYEPERRADHIGFRPVVMLTKSA
jgi:formylglycine-generating enzyme